MNREWYKEIKSKKDYKAYVGYKNTYEVMGAIQAHLLTAHGFNQNSTLLDIGCGSLRLGNWAIPNCKQYFGVEPEIWLIKENIKYKVKNNPMALKLLKHFKPQFRKSINNIKQSFDFIMLHSIFSYAPKSMINFYLKKCYDLLNNNGKLFFTYVAGNVNSKNKKWNYPGYVQYTKITIDLLIHKYKYKFKYLNWPHINQKWVMLWKN